jgi:hypothetical protein
VDPDSMNLDPDSSFQVNPDPDPRYPNDQKLKEKNTKIAIFLSLGFLKGRPSYRRSLQPSKKNI